MASEVSFSSNLAPSKFFAVDVLGIEVLGDLVEPSVDLEDEDRDDDPNAA